MVKTIVVTVTDREHREIAEYVKHGEARSMADFVRISTIMELNRLRNERR